MASLFPRKMYVDGIEMLAGQVMHFAVDASHRSLGPALLLQRATFDPVNSGELDFCYDCPPHDRGMSTFVRLGMHASCKLIRYALPFRSDEYFANKIGNAVWTKPAAAIANVFLSRRGARSPIRGLEIIPYVERFGDEFSVLDRLVSSAGMIRHRRSAEDLNYRYRENPELKHRVLVARRRGELLAFLVFVLESDSIATLVDLFGLELCQVGTPLLEALIDICRRENTHAVHGYCSEGSELKSLFKSSGFHPREKAAGVVPYAKPDTATHKLLDNGLRWSFGRVEWLG